ncbi:hypothetical protein ABZP36_011478 [Zizania latifolia]
MRVAGAARVGGVRWGWWVLRPSLDSSMIGLKLPLLLCNCKHGWSIISDWLVQTAEVEVTQLNLKLWGMPLCLLSTGPNIDMLTSVATDFSCSLEQLLLCFPISVLLVYDVCKLGTHSLHNNGDEWNHPLENIFLQALFLLSVLSK